MREGRRARPARIGEIEVQGPNVTPGYWNQPDKTAESFTADGWFRTGDIGERSTTTAISRSSGRAKDLIISGGLNIYPKEIEERIDALPASTSPPSSACPMPISARRWSRSSSRDPVTR